jgi:hypothetical protein
MGSYTVFTQGGGGGQQAPPQPMSFFVASTSKGDGANYGGIAGADAHCAMLAKTAGSTKTQWRAYLSTQGPGAVNARDRIGTGPWHNARGTVVARNQSHLHGDTLDEARIGNALTKANALSEKNTPINGVGDMPNEHDILTGSTADGRAYTDGMDHTCNNWTSNGMGSAQLGHSDRNGGGTVSWNSAHGSRGCSQPNLVMTGGAGKLYCFAVD